MTAQEEKGILRCRPATAGASASGASASGAPATGDPASGAIPGRLRDRAGRRILSQEQPQATAAATDFGGWSAAEITTLESLWLGSLPPLAPDPSNAVGDDPRAAELGQHIFFDTRFSANGGIACATCHIPAIDFIDSLSRAEGLDTTRRHTPSISGAAYNPWFFWDGRSDSQWAQALGPLEAAAEHGGSRTQYAHLIHDDADYRAAYEAIFGSYARFIR